MSTGALPPPFIGSNMETGGNMRNFLGKKWKKSLGKQSEDGRHRR